MSIESVGIVGSGIMGSGIAEVVAKAGYAVVVSTRRQESADRMLKRLARSLDRQVEKGRLEAAQAAAVRQRVSTTIGLQGLRECDLVIEAVIEDLATKKAVLAELDALLKPEAIIASNTSTLPLVELAMATRRPEQVVGVHFFNPAPVMRLVELVRPLTASDETVATARAFAAACGKDAVEVRDQAGFVVNALLFPYLNHAVRMVDSGVASRDDIDAAMTGGCNFPMGPLALLDLIGLDTSLSILDALYLEFRDQSYAAQPLLRRLVAAGKLGKKTGSGFYDYV